MTRNNHRNNALMLRTIRAKFPGACSASGCGRPIQKGDTIGYERTGGPKPHVYCESCLDQRLRDIAADDFDAMNNACL